MMIPLPGDPHAESERNFLAGIYPRFQPLLLFRIVRIAREHNPVYRTVWRGIRLWAFLLISILTILHVGSFRFAVTVIQVIQNSADPVAAQQAAVMAMPGRTMILFGGIFAQVLLFSVAPFFYAVWSYRKFYDRRPDIQVLPLSRPQFFQGLLYPAIVTVILFYLTHLLATIVMIVYIQVSFPDLINHDFGQLQTGADLATSIIGNAWGNFVSVIVFPLFFVTFVLRTLLLAQVCRHHHGLAVADIIRSVVLFSLMLGCWATIQSIAETLDSFLAILAAIMVGFIVVLWYFRSLWKEDIARAEIALFNPKEADGP